jgi:hypothetical protein
MKRPVMSCLLAGATLACAGAPAAHAGTIDPDVRTSLAAFAPGETLQVIVRLRAQEDVSGIDGATRAERLERLVRALQARARVTQSRTSRRCGSSTASR